MSERAMLLLRHNTKREPADATAVWLPRPGLAPSGTATRVCDSLDVTNEDDPMARIAGQGVQVFDELAELWPDVGEALDDADAWEVVLDHLADGTLPF